MGIYLPKKVGICEVSGVTYRKYIYLRKQVAVRSGVTIVGNIFTKDSR